MNSGRNRFEESGFFGVAPYSIILVRPSVFQVISHFSHSYPMAPLGMTHLHFSTSIQLIFNKGSVDSTEQLRSGLVVH